jgi:hypothetical protein
MIDEITSCPKCGNAVHSVQDICDHCGYELNPLQKQSVGQEMIEGRFDLGSHVHEWHKENGYYACCLCQKKSYKV